MDTPPPHSSERGSSAVIRSSPELPPLPRPAKKRKIRKTSNREIPKTPAHQQWSVERVKERTPDKEILILANKQNENPANYRTAKDKQTAKNSMENLHL
jgi:hypothetical protein